MKALFKSHNLLGDGINIGPALLKWHEKNARPDVFMDVLPDYTKVMYERMGLPVTFAENTDPSVYDFFFKFDCNEAFKLGETKGIHITHAYADLLGVDIGDSLYSYRPRFDVEEEDHEKDLVLLSLFSRSCTSQQGGRPNKMLPWNKAATVMEYLRQFGKIGILGAPGDRAPIEATEDEYFTGLPLNKVALMLRDCRFLLTIDNGLSHLSASQKTKSVVLYPRCLSPNWIAPIGNPNARIIQIDPATVVMTDLMWNIRYAIEDLGGRKL